MSTRALIVGAIAVAALAGWVVLGGPSESDRRGASEPDAAAAGDANGSPRPVALAARPGAIDAAHGTRGDRAASESPRGNDGMARATSVRGVVVDDGGPVVDAKVTASFSSPGSCLVMSTEAKTDAAGRFSVDDGCRAGADDVDVVVEKGSRRSGLVRCRRGAFERIALLEWGVLVGHVVDASDGRPLPRAVVHVQHPLARCPLPEQTVAASGEFRIECPLGRVDVTASATGFESSVSMREVGATGTTEIRLARDRASIALEGVVLRDGEAVALVQVRIPGRPHTTVSSVGFDPRFRLEGATSETAFLEVSTSWRFRLAPVRRTGARDGVVEIEVDFPPPQVLRGRVVRSGRPVEFARVSFERADDGRDFEATGANGRFALKVESTGPSWALRVRTPEGLLTNVSARDGADVEVPPAGRVHGRITDRRGRAIAGARVDAGIDVTIADDSGRFSLVLPEGRPRLHVSAPGFASADSPPIDVLDGAVFEREIPLDRGGALFGRVVDDTGAPIAGAILRVFGGTPVPWLVDGVRSKPDGTWASRNVAGTSFRVAASAPGHDDASVDGIEPDSFVPTFVLRRR